MAVHHRRAVELVDGHLQGAPRSLAVRPGHLDEDVVAEPTELAGRRHPVAARGQLFRDAHCVSHGGEDVELRQQQYQLPNDVVFGLPVQVPLSRRVRLQVDRPVADPLFGLPAEIGREQFRHRREHDVRKRPLESPHSLFHGRRLVAAFLREVEGRMSNNRGDGEYHILLIL